MGAPIAVVTGASAGVGRAIAQRFARGGYALGLVARDPERLADAVEEAASFGMKAIALPLDVADAAQLDEAAETVEKTLGPIDVWVNNAMASVFSPFLEMTSEEFHRVTDVTYLGVVHGTRSALKRMVPRNKGTIIQVGSALAYRGIPLQSAYCGAKHAIVGFTESLRAELLHDKSHIRVSMVHLPAVNTPQFDWVKSRLPHRGQPVPPIYQPEVPAEAVYFAAAHVRREIYVGWPTVVTIVGNKLFPGLLDRYLAKTGYKSQQTSEPRDPKAPNNLWHTVKGPWKAHGRFDRRAQSTSWQLWMSMHRGGLFGTLAALVLAGVTVWLHHTSN